MKQKNPERRAKNVTAAIADVRSVKNEFTMSELVIALKTANCPYPGEVASLLKKKNIITKRNGIYSFSSPEPVYYKTLINDLEEIYLKFKPKSNNLSQSSKEELIINYVKYLKELGYKIYKPITEYKEL